MLPIVDINILRQQTQTFIDVFPVEITLRRSTTTRTPSGGFTRGAPVALPPQIFTLLEYGATGNHSDGSVRALDGVNRGGDYVILGAWDCDMEAGDTFELATQPGRFFTITEMEYNNGWERRGYVSKSGKETF